MANQPTQTERPRIPFVISIDNRDETTSKDSRLVNGFFEKSISGKYRVFKRPGLSSYSTVSAATGLGIYNWKGDIYSVFGTSLLKNGVSIGTVNGAASYTFNATLGATPSLFLQNGAGAYYWDGATLHTIASPPTGLVPGSAYLDGTMYVMNGTAGIRGSGINDLSTWNSLNLIIAQIEPDAGVALAKQLVYVIAAKQWTTEAFYDAANSTGSPLGAVQGAKMNYGCRVAASMQDVGGDLIWLGQTREGSQSFVMCEGLRLEPLPNPPIDRLFQKADYSTVYSMSFKIGGHRFYLITLKNSNLTLVYDLTSGLWSQWTDTNGNYFPYVSATYTSSQQVLFQHELNGTIAQLDETVYQDIGQTITFDLITPPWDGGVRKVKMLNRMDFIGDTQPGSVLFSRHTDDDYQSWSNFRQVDLSKKRHTLDNCGSFTRRAWQFRHTANTPLRMEGVELDVLEGTL